MVIIREKRRRFCVSRGLTFKSLLISVLVLVAATVILVGCSNEDDKFDEPPPVFEAQIFSDPAADGDIAFTPPETYTISSALTAGNVFAGIDPASGDEFRGFLDFALRGPHGIPLKAVVESATLEIFINSVATPASGDTVPLLIDLVSFQPPSLIADDFDRLAQPPLLTMPFEIFPADAGTFVLLDVTGLMVEAQSAGLPDFQLRLLLDFTGNTGLIEIDDNTAKKAPLLTVAYF